MNSAIKWMIVSYLIGSFPTGYVVTRIAKGMDIRSTGSGSIGATNVRRVMGQGWGAFVAIMDMLKGALALLATWGVTGASATTTPWLLSLAGFAAVIGHNYPVWLKFKGGKGVSTTYGVLFFLWPYESFAITLLCGGIWYAIMMTTRYVSFASMISLLIAPLFFWILDAPFSFVFSSFVLAIFSIYRHRSNIDRLMRGVENRA